MPGTVDENEHTVGVSPAPTTYRSIPASVSQKEATSSPQTTHKLSQSHGFRVASWASSRVCTWGGQVKILGYAHIHVRSNSCVRSLTSDTHGRPACMLCLTLPGTQTRSACMSGMPTGLRMGLQEQSNTGRNLQVMSGEGIQFVS